MHVNICRSSNDLTVSSPFEFKDGSVPCEFLSVQISVDNNGLKSNAFILLPFLLVEIIFISVKLTLAVIKVFFMNLYLCSLV